MTFILFNRLLRWLFLTIVTLVAVPLALGSYYTNTSTPYGSESASTSLTPSTESQTSTSNDNSTSVSFIQELTASNIVGNGLYPQIMAEWVITVLIGLFGE